MTPVLGYRYASFSGDDNLADNRQKAWDPLSKGFVDWSTWLVGDVVGNYLLFNSNENVQQFSLKTHLSQTFTLGAIHYQFWLDEKNYMGAAVSDRRFTDGLASFELLPLTQSAHGKSLWCKEKGLIGPGIPAKIFYGVKILNHSFW